MKVLDKRYVDVRFRAETEFFTGRDRSKSARARGDMVSHERISEPKHHHHHFNFKSYTVSMMGGRGGLVFRRVASSAMSMFVDSLATPLVM